MLEKVEFLVRVEEVQGFESLQPDHSSFTGDALKLYFASAFAGRLLEGAADLAGVAVREIRALNNQHAGHAVVRRAQDARDQIRQRLRRLRHRPARLAEAGGMRGELRDREGRGQWLSLRV